MAKPYDMQENLFQAIDTIVQSRIAGLPYDKTIECKVIDISKSLQGIYKVEYQDTTFECSSLIANLKLNDLVYVSIPQNDFRQDKLILAKKQKATTRTVKVLPFLSFVKGINLFSEAQNQADYTLTVNGGSSNSRFVFGSFYGNDLAAGYTRLGVKMAVNAGMPANTVSGDYGLMIQLYGYDQSILSGDSETLATISRGQHDTDDSAYCRTYYLNKKDMISTNIYNTHGYANQEKVIDVTNFVIDRIMISLWQDDDFRNNKGDKITNQKISFTNLSLFLGYDISDFGKNNTRSYLYTYDGLIYGHKDDHLDKKMHTRILIKDRDNNYENVTNDYSKQTTWNFVWEKYNAENSMTSDLSNRLGFSMMDDGTISNSMNKLGRTEVLNFSQVKYGYLLVLQNNLDRTEKYISNTMWFISEAIKDEFDFSNVKDEIPEEAYDYTLAGDYYISGNGEEEDSNILRFNDIDGNLLLRLDKTNTSYFAGTSNVAQNYDNSTGNIVQKFLNIDENITNIKSQLNEINNNSNNNNNNNTNQIESYFEEELEDTIDKVKYLQTEPSLVFLVCTDIHYGSHDTTLFPKTVMNMKAFSEKVRTDGIICLGDMTDGDKSKQVTSQLNDKVMSLLRSVGLPIYFSAGNHDCNPQYNIVGQSSFTHNEMYKEYYSKCANSVFSDKYGTNTIAGAGMRTGLNFYKDFNEHQIRLISLYGIHTEADSYPQFTGENNEYKYTEETISWLGSILSSTPEGYKILLITHYSPDKEHNWAKTGPSDNSNMDILEELKNWRNDAPYNRIISFVGHTHADFVSTFYTHITEDLQQGDIYSTFPCLEIGFFSNKIGATDYDWTNTLQPNGELMWPDWPENAQGWKRTAGTATEDSWDAVVIRPFSGKVNCIRFGAGRDREFNML